MPLLAVEVVCHPDCPSPQKGETNRPQKRLVYARLGIQEYWRLATNAAAPLSGYTLDSTDGESVPLTEYRRIAVAPDGAQRSHVLGTSLRWAGRILECWHAEWARWVPTVDILNWQAEREAELRGEQRGWLHSLVPRLHRILDPAAPGAAAQVQQQWERRPPATWPSEETLVRLETTPQEWRHLLQLELPLEVRP